MPFLVRGRCESSQVSQSVMSGVEFQEPKEDEGEKDGTMTG